MKTFAVILTGLLLISCDSKPETTSLDIETKQADKKTVVEESSETKKRFEAPDRIFGLPVPADVVSLVEFPTYTVVITEWDLDQVERFFQKELVDFETVRDDGVLRIIGLRSYMASARASYNGKRKKRGVSIRYYPGKEEDQTKAAKPTPKPEKGQPVELTTKDGKQLAPGAKWYEPYTPPPGSPLDKPRYKGNFGTPFGKWANN